MNAPTPEYDKFLALEAAIQDANANSAETPTFEDVAAAVIEDFFEHYVNSTSEATAAPPLGILGAP